MAELGGVSRRTVRYYVQEGLLSAPLGVGRGRHYDTVRRALATAVAIVWLETHALDAQIEWELLADKGVRWLQSCGASPAGGGDWLAIGRAVVV